MADAPSASDTSVAITVAMPVYNAAATIAAQLDALASQDYVGEWEVVIADNRSTDESTALALAFADRLPGLRVIDASGRRGVSHARNAALAAARGDVIAICDADDVVDPGWLRAIGEAVREWDLVGGSLDEDTLNAPVVRAWRGLRGRSASLPVHRGFLAYAIGCNFAARTVVVRDLGGWNEDYVGGMDDVEFSWRAQLAGYRLGYAADAVVHRRHRASLTGLARQYYGYGRATPQLNRDFRERGVQPRTWSAGVRQWLWLAKHIGFLFSSAAQRGWWVRIAAKNAGHLVGNLRYRVARR